MSFGLMVLILVAVQRPSARARNWPHAELISWRIGGDDEKKQLGLRLEDAVHND